MAETQKPISEIMRKITGNLRTQMNNPNKLMGITPEMMADTMCYFFGDGNMRLRW